MKLITMIDAETLGRDALVAESNELAIYDIGSDTFAFVHRPASVEWQATTVLGNGLFRVQELPASITRSAYRAVAAKRPR